MQGLPYVVIVICFGLGGALIAHVKGNPRLILFAICAVLPFVGIIAALAARSEIDEPRRRCDRCGTVMPISQTICTRCGLDLDFPEEQLPSLKEQLTDSSS
jgi:uncharacterized OB-fold protein